MVFKVTPPFKVIPVVYNHLHHNYTRSTARSYHTMKPTEAVTECNIKKCREVDPVRCAASVAVYLAETNADNSRLVYMLTGFDLYNTALKAASDEYAPSIKGVVNCQNSRDKGPPEGNSARG